MQKGISETVHKGQGKTFQSPGIRINIARLNDHVHLELHDPDTGRLDGQKIANAIAVPAKEIARVVGVSPAALQKNPAARSIQAPLREIVFSLATLQRLLGSREAALVWLNAPNPEFEGKAPLQLILDNKADAVAGLIRDVLAGQIS